MAIRPEPWRILAAPWEMPVRAKFDEAKHPRDPDGKFGDKIGTDATDYLGDDDLREALDALHEEPEGAQLEAFEMYTTPVRPPETPPYQIINGSLRGLRDGTPATDQAIANLDALIERQTPLDKPAVLWRGLDPDLMPPGAFDALVAGATFEEPAFMSTTPSERGDVEMFATSRETGKAGVLMRIAAPAGTKMLWAMPTSFEDEILLARGQRFRVIERDENHPTRDGGTMTRIDLELLP
jgi:hypothetical protein